MFILEWNEYYLECIVIYKLIELIYFFDEMIEIDIGKNLL